jgi:hypothetical protein
VDETVAARIFIYFVKNGGANELATLLNNVLTGKETNKQEKKESGRRIERSGKSLLPGENGGKKGREKGGQSW